MLDECQENRQVASHRLHCRRKTLECDKDGEVAGTGGLLEQKLQGVPVG